MNLSLIIVLPQKLDILTMIRRFTGITTDIEKNFQLVGHPFLDTS